MSKLKINSSNKQFTINKQSTSNLNTYSKKSKPPQKLYIHPYNNNKMSPPKILLLLLILTMSTTSIYSIYDQYLDQCKKIAQAMTIDQKIGQTIQLTFEGITEKQVTDPQQALKFALGSLLIGGDGAPSSDGNIAKMASYLEQEKNKQIYLNATAANWKKLTDKFTNIGVPVTTKDNKKYLIKLLLGTDAVHGDQHVVGNILFPHNIGLSCTHNPDNFENLGHWTKEGVKRSGFNFVFAPCVAVSHNPQWGRTYESMGQEDAYIEQYAKSYVRGLQDIFNGKLRGALGSAKHFIGDGSTRYGANEGEATVLNFRNYIEHNVKGYRGAVNSDVGTVMVSYSSVNFLPNSFNSMFLMGVLRQQEGFAGFTISDYDDIIRAERMSLPRTFINMTEQNAYTLMVNAGVDMIMLSSHKALVTTQLERIIKEAKKAVSKDYVFVERLDEAVARILAVKMAMGLITTQNSEEEQPQQVEQTEQKPLQPPTVSSGNQYIDSLTAVRESLVVLKNSNVLPVKGLSDSIKHVILVGEQILNINRLTKVELYRNFDNIGMQSGGWSVRWQGFQGNDFWKGENKASANASSVLDALKGLQATNNFSLIYPNYTTFTNQVQIELERRQFLDQLKNLKKNFTAKNTLIIGVFGQVPYAESQGDVNIPYCRISDLVPFCLYNPILNPYVPAEQAKDMTCDFSKFENEIITEVRSADKTIPFVSVLLTGRPVPIGNLYETSSAVIAAWLPGTSGGQGIVDLISGAYVARPGGSSNRKNSLSVDWPRNMKALQEFPIYGSDGSIPKMSDIQFPVGFGLSTELTGKHLSSE